LCHPARVVGDSQHTIQELVELANIERHKISPNLGPILLDDECQIRLSELGISERYIPAEEEIITLCYTNAPERGGTCDALRVKMCKENRKIMRKVAEVLDLGLAEIYVECIDINTPFSQSQAVILGANHRPSALLYEAPLNGKSRPVTKIIMKSFIFRHPLAYLHSLFSNKLTRLYKRTGIILILLALTYWFALTVQAMVLT
jgi:hypothetical protein